MVVDGLLTQACEKKSSSCSRTDGCKDALDTDVAAAPVAEDCGSDSSVGTDALPRLGDAGGDGLSGIEYPRGEVGEAAAEEPAVEVGGGCSGRNRMTVEYDES